MEHIKRAFCIGIIILVLVSNSFVRTANATSSQNRLAGQDRFATAVAIASSGWEKSNFAILAYGYNYPDALAATPLAKKYDAPILLTEKDSLTPVTKQELLNLNTKNVFIVGGIGVISTAVENELIDMGIIVTRLAGENRYDTAVKIAEQLENVSKVVVVTGDQYAGALSVASIAAKGNMPILLVQGNSLPESVKEYLSGKSIAKTYVIGDINDRVINQLSNTELITGSNIYEINTNVLQKFDAEYNYDNVFIATGEDFADALAGTAYAAKTSAPILLVNATKPLVTVQYMNSKIAVIKQTIVLGSEGVVANTLVSDYLNGNSTNNIGGKYTPSEIVNLLKLSVVNIETFDQNGKALGQGSGFVCDANGKIGTNYHVIDGAYGAKVTISNGQVYDVEKVLGYDSVNDIALLKINATGLSPITMGDSENSNTGDKVYAIGNPLGLENTISDGLISSKSRTVDEVNYIQISVPISPGSSGGVLVNEQARVVGITVASLDYGQNINFAIPINTFKTILSSNLNMDLKGLYANKMSESEFVNYLNQTYGYLSVNNRTIGISWSTYESSNYDVGMVGHINISDYDKWENASKDDQTVLISIFNKIKKDAADNFAGKTWNGFVIYKNIFGSKPSNFSTDELDYNPSTGIWTLYHVIARFYYNGYNPPSLGLRY